LNQKKFNQIIDFAIKREHEAVGFYRDIKKLISFENSVELLDNLEEMERVHIEILEGIRIKTMKNVLLPRGETLEVEKHQVKINPSKDMSYHDILTLAIQREEESLQLYNKLSSQPYQKIVFKAGQRRSSPQGYAGKIV
jgi:rubrerythrin